LKSITNKGSGNIDRKYQQDDFYEEDIYIGNPAVIYAADQYLWVVLTIGIALFIYWIYSISTKYYITSQKIQIEKGIFSKHKDDIELYRIDDFVVKRPFLMRLLGYGIIYFISSDRSLPKAFIYGLKNVDSLHDKLRTCALKERKRREIKVWANA
jgi:Bacterial PH domain